MKEVREVTYQFKIQIILDSEHDDVSVEDTDKSFKVFEKDLISSMEMNMIDQGDFGVGDYSITKI